MPISVDTDNLFAALCRVGMPRLEAAEIVERISERAELEEVQQMPVSADLDFDRIPVFREALLRREKQGEERGREIGKEIGKQIGAKEGEVRLLRRQLEHRFGPLPDWAIQKIEAADSGALGHWSVRVLRAATLSEVLETDGSA